MQMELTIIYKDNTRLDLNFSPSEDLYLKITDYIAHVWGSDCFATSELSPDDIKAINSTDDTLKNYLKNGCILDCLIHRYIIIRQ